MDDLLNECLKDLDVLLQWLELPCEEKLASSQAEKCKSSLLAAKTYLTAKIEKGTPLKWLNLRTGIYNPLMRAGYQTVESIACLAPWQLLAIPKIGAGYKDEIVKALEKWTQGELKTPCH
jgi:hypothetical protein